MLPRLVFLLENLAKNTPKQKRFEYDQIKIWFSVTKRCGHEATEKRKAKKNHKLPSSRHFLKSKMPLLVNFSLKFSPLFNRFSTFDKNVNLSKANPEAENSFLAFPSLNTSIFTTYPKIASTLTPFEGPDSKVTLPNSKV